MIVINVSGLLLGRLVQEVHKFHRTSFHFVYYTVYQHHQVVVSKHGNDTHDQTAYAPAARPVHAAPVLVMGKLPGGHCPTHSKPHPDRPQISQPEPPRPRRRASEARHSVRHTARHFFKSKAQTRHILAVSHPL